MEYLTHKWFRLTDGPKDQKHTDRTPTLEVWQTVQQRAQQWAGASGGQALVPIVAAPIRLDQLVLQVVGVMVTVMARERIKIDSSEMFLQAAIERIKEMVLERDMAAEVYRLAVELGVFQP